MTEAGVAGATCDPRIEADVPVKASRSESRLLAVTCGSAVCSLDDLAECRSVERSSMAPCGSARWTPRGYANADHASPADSTRNGPGHGEHGVLHLRRCTGVCRVRSVPARTDRVGYRQCRMVQGGPTPSGRSQVASYATSSAIRSARSHSRRTGARPRPWHWPADVRVPRLLRDADPRRRASGRRMRQRRHPRPLPRAGAARPRVLGVDLGCLRKKHSRPSRHRPTAPNGGC